jgi:hypothetical protein
VLPRLEERGRRVRAALAGLVASGAPGGQDVVERADRHLATLAELADAVRTASVLPTGEDGLDQEAADAASGLRFYAAAKTELTGQPAPLT